MTITREYIATRWKEIQPSETSVYSSLRVSAESKPELFLASDKSSDRFLILHVPAETKISCSTVILRNLSIEWHPETRFVVIGLRNIRFADLFSDLTLSLYNRISNSSDQHWYTTEFISSFHRWADFFDDVSSSLSENTIKGLFGEMTALKWLLKNTDQLPVNSILRSWQGPYNRAQDLIFPEYNLEVKTKDRVETTVNISSEFQLMPETEKGLHLCIVDVVSNDKGMTIADLMNELSLLIRTMNGDVEIFIETLARAGLNFVSATNYEGFRWKTISLTFYDCCLPGFPKIMAEHLPDAISRVKYNLNVPLLDAFIMQRVIF
jgi:hypothetical protein